MRVLPLSLSVSSRVMFHIARSVNEFMRHDNAHLSSSYVRSHDYEHGNKKIGARDISGWNP